MPIAHSQARMFFVLLSISEMFPVGIKIVFLLCSFFNNLNRKLKNANTDCLFYSLFSDCGKINGAEMQR